uniref:Uncharacterized protein n=1 Tax=Parascaris univalens TaxID=6257 RepID=A0A915AVN9_PARUN
FQEVPFLTSPGGFPSLCKTLQTPMRFTTSYSREIPRWLAGPQADRLKKLKILFLHFPAKKCL